MRHLELHIIQSVPVSCLNRDDLNSPKTAIFGGVQRARVSSQSWKRAIRELAENEYDKSGQFKGKRSRLFISQIAARLKALGEKSEDMVMALSHCAGHYLAKLDSKKDGKVKTLVFLSPFEYDILSKVLFDLSDADKQELSEAFAKVDSAKLAKDEDGEEESEEEEQPKKNKGEKKVSVKQFTKLVSKALKSPIEKAFKGEKKDTKSLEKDAADFALFGRMVANDHSLFIEAASMFSHALSTHKVDNEIDFFAAVDDLQPKAEAGAGMTSTLEFNSATYYRFAALNLDMLADDDHLKKSMSKEERQSVVRTFLEATIKAIPSARKNTMNGNTVPDYVLGIVREKGHPVQLVNAFETPLKSNSGYSVDAIKRMNAEYADLQETWGVDGIAMATIKKSLSERLKSERTDKAEEKKEAAESIAQLSLNELLDRMVAHVI